MLPTRHLFALLALAGLAAAPAQAQPLTTAFTYQGDLRQGGAAQNGPFDLRFRLYDALTGGTQVGAAVCTDNVAVAAGRFTVPLDFGASPFAGARRFLEIDARPDTGADCSNSAGFTTLGPRQELTATPYALYAGDAAGLNGQPASFYSFLSGDVTGALASTSVVRLQGRPVAAAAPATGQVLKWTGTQWAPASDETSTVPPTTRYKTLGAAAFTPLTNTLAFRRDISGLTSETTSGTVEFAAPLDLPHGATITDVTAWVYENDGASDVSVAIQKSVISATGGSAVCYGSSAGAVNGNRSFGMTNVVGSQTIDLLSFSYSVRATWGASASTPNTIMLISVKVSYTVTSTLP